MGPQGVPDLYGIGDDAFGSGKAIGASIWLRQRKRGETGLYVGIACDTNELVDAAYPAAIKAGGTDEGEPADRTYFAGLANGLDRRAARHGRALASAMAPAPLDQTLNSDTSGPPEHHCGHPDTRRPDD